MKDYHGILRVRRNATLAEIRKAYRKLAMQYHPDRNKEPGASERFREISEAYAVLSGKERAPVPVPGPETRNRQQGTESRGHAGTGMDVSWGHRVINIWQGIMEKKYDNMYR
jgi:DnaJ-class molecular chaperone